MWAVEVLNLLAGESLSAEAVFWEKIERSTVLSQALRE